ncbi:DUF11 domain-containing protein [Candidatus Saccharibacteria bacterium]|nr:DUF11 domain-containing protein [Candidatus Saccharibacteria bacterium]
MKRYIKLLSKQLFVAAATVAIVAGVAANTFAAFGPSRETRAWTSNENGFDHVTFNSFTGVPNGIGDERDFLRGVQVGRDSVWSDPVTSVNNDTEVEMKIYIHNNADSALNDQPGNPGVAKNVTVRTALPTGAAQAQQVTSYIKADNARPGEIFDTLDLTGSNSGFFELSYIPGSAKLHTGTQVSALSDTLVTTGVNIGDQKGCFEYVREITFRVKVKMPSYATQKTVRNHGEDSTKWREVANTKIGDKVDWRIWFKNSGTTQLNAVKVVDNLPPHVRVVPGSVKLYNGNYPVANGGYTYPASAVQNDGKQVNVDIGAYLPGGDAYVVFTTEVLNDKEIACGYQQLANVAYTTPEGYGALNDSARINVINDKECAGPSYICESLTVDKIGGRKVRATVKAPVSGNAKVKTVTYNYGDASTAKVTDKLVDEYEYKADGTYKITATVTFTVNGADKVVTSDNCAKMVTFTTTPTKELPKTGAGSIVGLFAATSLVGAAAHNVISRRRA